MPWRCSTPQAPSASRLAIGSVGLVSPHVLFKLGLERLPAVPGLAESPCAVLGQIEIDHVSVTFASVALPALEGPQQRAWQMEALLDRIDAYDRYLPVLIGGDFNTNTFELEDKHRRAADPALAADPHRLVEPQPWEPMFAELADRGYDWRSCNVPLAATQRTRPDGTPKPPFGKIDWLFARGLRCSDPAVVPAVDDAGVAISDHEALAVTIAPA